MKPTANLMSNNDIFIIDDTNANIEFLQEILENAGYNVRSANTGESALECISEKLPSLILLDIKLPDIDGFEVCAKLKSDINTQTIPIIFISVLNDELSKEKGFKVGGVDFITKPFQRGEVLSRVKTHIELRKLHLDLASKNEQLSQDIVTLKDIEVKLMEEERRLKGVIEGTNVGTWEWNVLTGETTFNERWAEIIGYTLAELEPLSIKTWETLVHPEDLKKSNDHLLEIFSREKTYYDIECRMKHKNGEWIWVRDRGKVTEWTQDCKAIKMAGTHTDISESKIKETQIKQANSLLTATLESTADGILVVDKAKRITGFNNKFIELWHVPTSIIESRNDNELLAFATKQLKDPEAFLSKINELYANDALTSYDILEFKDGRIFERYSQSQTIEENAVGRVWSFRDITERTNVETELKESDKSYMGLFNSVSEAIYILDENGYFVDVNNGAEKMYAYKREEIIGKTPEFLSAAGMNDLGQVQQIINNVLKTGVSQQFEFWGKRKNGDAFPKDVVANKGKFFGKDVAICTARDITERKHNEIELKESEENLKQLNEIASQMLVLPDLESIYKFIVESLSKRLPDTIILYNSIDEANNKTRLELVAGIENKLLNKILSISGFNPIGKQYNLVPLHNSYFRSGSIIKFEGGLAEFSATEFPSIIAHSLEKLVGLKNIYTIGINKDEQLLAAIHFFTFNEKELEDIIFIESLVRQAGIILQKRIAELALKENETRLRELNATKDKFFSIIAHDLRSPFNAIMGFSDLMVEHIEEKNYDSLEEYAKIIYTSSQRTIDLLSNLMDWANTQSGKMEFKPEYFELISLVNEVVDISKDSANPKSITIVKDIPRSAPIYADKPMISTVLRNLISNAVKFTKPEGQITVKIENTKEKIKLSVIDNGVGIRKDAINKLFRIDESYSTSGTLKEKGTGLGLILCKEFISKHGGEIGLESEEGAGSMFYFTIPKS